MYEFQMIKKIEEAAYNAFIADSQRGNFRQTTYWGEIKKASGWDYACYALKKNDEIIAVATILIRSIKKIPFSLLYCCRGPVVDWRNSEYVSKLFEALVSVVKEHNGLCLRFDPEPDEYIDKQQVIFKKDQIVNIADRVTVWNRALYSTRVMLDASEEQLFQRMRNTLRQNINKAIKSGVEILTEPSFDDKKNFYELMCGLEERRNSLIHSKDYYDAIFENTVEKNTGFFLKAVYKGNIISGLVVVIVGDKAWALYLANDYKFRKFMPNKLLLWESIRLANKFDCKFIDLGSTQGTDRFNPNEDGLDLIKAAYKPVVVEFPGYYDVRGKFYMAFRILEKYILPKFLFFYYRIQRLSSLGVKKNQ